MKPITLTDAELQAAVAVKAGGPSRHGKPVLFPDKKPGMVFLTDAGRTKLRVLSAGANVSLSDFLEVLIRRYGAKAETDILDATDAARGEDGADASTA